MRVSIVLNDLKVGPGPAVPPLSALLARPRPDSCGVGAAGGGPGPPGTILDLGGATKGNTGCSGSRPFVNGWMGLGGLRLPWGWRRSDMLILLIVILLLLSLGTLPTWPHSKN